MARAGGAQLLRRHRPPRWRRPAATALVVTTLLGAGAGTDAVVDGVSAPAEAPSVAEVDPQAVSFPDRPVETYAPVVTTGVGTVTSTNSTETAPSITSGRATFTTPVRATDVPGWPVTY